MLGIFFFIIIKSVACLRKGGIACLSRVFCPIFPTSLSTLSSQQFKVLRSRGQLFFFFFLYFFCRRWFGKAVINTTRVFVCRNNSSSDKQIDSENGLELCQNNRLRGTVNRRYVVLSLG
uniref:Putative secreted protein n=1 Tax=Ixodes scapularis TaxID=6945 RepID=A0A4D5RFJ8_IXOSC